MKQIKLKIEKCADCIFVVCNRGIACTRGVYHCYNPEDTHKGRIISDPDVIDTDCILDDWEENEYGRNVAER